MEIRKVSAEEMEQAVRLVDKTFREEGHTSMGVAFPQMFSAGNKHSFGAFDGNKLVSFMGLVPNKIRVGAAVLNVFSIGAVCTDEAYRKQGISTAMLAKVYEYIDQAGASLLFISGDRGLYLRNNCFHYGQSHHYTIKHVENAPDYEGIIRLRDETDLFELDQLRNEREVRFEGGIWEWELLLEASGYTSISKMKQSVFVAEGEGRVEGYVVIGLSHDPSSKGRAIVTELGGKPEIVDHIIRDIFVKFSLELIDVVLPWHEAYHEVLEAYRTKVTQSDSTIYLVDPERFLKQIQPYLFEKDAKLAEDVRLTKREKDVYELRLGEIRKEVALGELIDLFFCLPKEPNQSDLQTIFPIPLPHTEGVYFV